ncbi:MAG: glycosyltransferase family 4 protein [Acidobacteria bacterium]|nr:glycosyltransferase family 4 protein [Acidobacteriota bacterium]
MKMAILCPDFPPKRSGLADHTFGLTRWLAGRCEVEVFTSPNDGSVEETAPALGAGRGWIRRGVAGWDFSGMGRLQSELERGRFDWAIIQYVPHMYGRWGFNWALPYAMGEMRADGIRCLLWVHELFLDWSLRPRRLAAGAAQRLMLAACLAASHRVVVSSETWLERLKRSSPDRSAEYLHLPSPCNFEPEIEAVGIGRREGESPSGSNRITFGFFGTLHDSKLVGHLAVTLESARAAGWRAKLLCVGPEAKALAGRLNGPGQAISASIESTGFLPPTEVVRRLQEVDIFLLPLLDGVSMRRSSLMAAFSLGLPVVGTDGPLTDPVLRQSKICRLAPAKDAGAFAREALSLAANLKAARAQGDEGRRFYQRMCSWDSVGRRLWQVLGAGS